MATKSDISELRAEIRELSRVMGTNQSLHGSRENKNEFGKKESI